MFKTFLRDRVLANGITTAIETGTNQAGTTKFLAQHFSRVISIELSEPLYRAAEELEFPNRQNVEFIHGDSVEHVARLANEIEEPCFWYLDAHYCHHTGYEAKSEFPLWKELAAIKSRAKQQDVIWVDDVHTCGKARPDLGEPWEDITSDSLTSFFPGLDSMIVDNGFVIFSEVQD